MRKKVILAISILAVAVVAVTLLLSLLALRSKFGPLPAIVKNFVLFACVMLPLWWYCSRFRNAAKRFTIFVALFFALTLSHAFVNGFVRTIRTVLDRDGVWSSRPIGQLVYTISKDAAPQNRVVLVSANEAHTPPSTNVLQGSWQHAKFYCWGAPCVTDSDYAVGVLRKHGYRHVVVVSKKELAAGIIQRGDFVLMANDLAGNRVIVNMTIFNCENPFDQLTQSEYSLL